MPFAEFGMRTLRMLNRIGIRKPLIQGPVSFVTTPKLVAAVSNEGALGTLPCAWHAPALMRRHIQQVRRKTHYPFAVSLVARPSAAASATPSAPLDAQQEAALVAYNQQLNVYREELGLPLVDYPLASEGDGGDHASPSSTSSHAPDIDQTNQLQQQPSSGRPSSYQTLRDDKDEDEDEEDAFNSVRMRRRERRSFRNAPSVLPSLDDQIEVVLQNDVPVVYFSFGIPDEHIIKELKSEHVVLIGVATTVEEGRALQESGFDVVVAQGFEASGMRGDWLRSNPDGGHGIGTLSLLPSMVDALDVPVVASGGIMDGRGIAAVLALGASAAQIGTGFLQVRESGLSEKQRKRFQDSGEHSTLVSSMWTGRPGRALRAPRFDKDMAAVAAEFGVPPFPEAALWSLDVQHRAVELDLEDLHAVWCSQGVSMFRTDRPPVAQFIKDLAKEYFSTMQAVTDIETSMRVLRKRDK